MIGRLVENCVVMGSLYFDYFPYQNAKQCRLCVAPRGSLQVGPFSNKELISKGTFMPK